MLSTWERLLDVADNELVPLLGGRYSSVLVPLPTFRVGAVTERDCSSLSRQLRGWSVSGSAGVPTVKIARLTATSEQPDRQLFSPRRLLENFAHTVARPDVYLREPEIVAAELGE